MSHDLLVNVELARSVFDQERLVGYPTGLRELDNLVGGLKKKSLTILAGATGIGKSLLSLNIAINLVRKGVGVTYIDLENGKEVAWERLVRIWSGLGQDYVRDPDNMMDFAKKMQEITEAGLNFFDHTDVQKHRGKLENDVKTVLRIVRKVKGGVFDSRVVFIDPLQALEGELDSGRLLQEQGKLVETLKNIAQEEDLSIVLCHHIRKSVYNSGNLVNDLEEEGAKEIKYRVPSIEDLRGSGKIADFATDVWGILRAASSENPAKRSKTLIRILKNRTGQKGDAWAYLNEKTLTFHNLARFEKPIQEIFNGQVQL